MTNDSSTSTQSNTQGTHREDEFSSFSIAIDKVLINPNTKVGRHLYEAYSKSSIKDEDRLKGKGSEGETFRRLLKELQARGNFKDILTFAVNGKNHDLANAPEVTSIQELVDYNSTTTWSHDSVAATQGEIIKLSDKAKQTDAEKQELRISFDRRAKNQIVRVYLSKILDPDLYTTLVGKSANAPHLHRKDQDNADDTVIDGTVLLLLVSKMICPSTTALVENLKLEASELQLKDHDHDVSNVVNKFEEIVARIHSLGKVWDDEIPAMFKVLLTSEDSQFNTAIQLKDNEHCAGTLTKLSEITTYATSIYTNQAARKKWMVPDPKQVKIAALLTKVNSLETAIASGSKSAFTSDSSNTPKQQTSTIDAWRFEFKGDKVNRDGKDWYWCDHHSHKRSDNAFTNGMYCSTHGKGHPEHDHSSWTQWKRDNPFGKRKRFEARKQSESSQQPSSTGISLNEKLKNALLTRTACTEADIAALSQQDF